MSRIQYLGNAPSGTVVVAAGPLVKQPASMPYRLVLLEYPDDKKYSVHRQGWTEIPSDPFIVASGEGSYLQSGNYFPFTEATQGATLTAALKQFAGRLTDEAAYMESVYRA